MTTAAAPPIERLAARARIHAALGEPSRLALAELLAFGDRTPSELAAVLGVGTNLLAHHLNTLEDAGVIARSPSHGDARRRYVRLEADAVAGLLELPTIAASSVLFVCTHNAARSQLAAALWNRRSEVPAASAGTEPAERIHPRAVRVAAAHGLDLDDATPRSYGQVDPADLVVSVCDRALESRPGFGDHHLHWSVPDPADEDTDRAFEAAFAELAARVDHLAPRVGAAA